MEICLGPHRSGEAHPTALVQRGVVVTFPDGGRTTSIQGRDVCPFVEARGQLSAHCHRR